RLTDRRSATFRELLLAQQFDDQLSSTEITTKLIKHTDVVDYREVAFDHFFPVQKQNGVCPDRSFFREIILTCINSFVPLRFQKLKGKKP
ncbi:MAG: hypothetical protein O7D30_04550, partial [Rickettsia endosymbiont of Ixodes persulcatus]|nr:hypothetical protein [Rickettsia endosymbiont of Ixodes persulcatus]